MVHLSHPGYTSILSTPPGVTSPARLPLLLRDDEALGSEREIPLGESLPSVLRSSILLGLVGTSAHCYSALPGRNGRLIG